MSHAVCHLVNHADDTDPREVMYFDRVYGKRQKLNKQFFNRPADVNVDAVIRLMQARKKNRALNEFIEDKVRLVDKYPKLIRVTHFKKNSKVLAIYVYKNKDGTKSWREGL